ncbi:MAG: T9SS type A sorting domain-containing protein [Chlorobi bacterium]|nr:T9SS type A sorting domain-containing protein [Chlorobiota bacterium]MCI0716389.1 T9SS type A sorting domain-containing protein [Chlorobiota bacterium]
MKKFLIIFSALLYSACLYSDWQKINSFPVNYVQDIYISGGIVYAATANNGVYKSTDGTLSWVQISSGLNNPQALQCVQVISNGGSLYAATFDGIYKSTNFGANWIKKSTGIIIGNGANYEFCESIFEHNNNLFTGAYTGLYRSTNGGESWLATNITGMHIWAKNFTLHNGTIFAARETGNQPNGYFSTDNGITWNSLSSISVPSITFFSEPGKLFAGTIHGAWLSTNNGSSWLERSNGYSPDPYTSSFVRVNAVLVSSLKFGGSGIYKSTNDGILWENFGQGLPFLSNIDKLVIFNNKILAATSGGIYQRNASEVTGITQISTEIPASFSLSQNYPNPFNPVTKIRFELPAGVARRVALTVFDALGKETASLVNEQLTPGTYEVSFNGSDLTSGAYFYSLQAGEFTETKKMILVK